MAQEYQKQSGEFPKITILNAHEVDMVGITKEFHRKYEPLSYTATLVRGKTQITVSSFKDFANLTRFLHERQVNYTLLKDKPKTIDLVIRGIPSDVESYTVHQELNKLGIHPTEVINLKSASGVPYPIYRVSIPEGPEVDKTNKLTGLCYYTVRVEPYRSKRQPPQCTRCQQFFHTIGTCMNIPCCRKCAGPHQTHKCRQPDDAPRVCVLCDGNHCADSLDCIIVKTVMEETTNKKQQRPRNRNTPITRDRQQPANRRAAADPPLQARKSTNTAIEANRASVNTDEVLPPSPGPSYSKVVTTAVIHQPATVRLPPETPTKREKTKTLNPIPNTDGATSTHIAQQQPKEARTRQHSGGERPSAQERVRQMRRDAQAMLKPPSANVRPTKSTEPVSPPVVDSSRDGNRQQQEEITNNPPTNNIGTSSQNSETVTAEPLANTENNSATVTDTQNIITTASETQNTSDIAPVIQNTTTIATVNTENTQPITNDSSNAYSIVDSAAEFFKSKIENTASHKLIDAIVKAIKAYSTQGTFSAALNAFMSHMMGF